MCSNSSLINKLFKNKLLRFVTVGGLNTAFGYGVFALLLYIGIKYPIASLISYIIGVFFNFKTIGVIVFNNNNNKLIFKFLGVYGITYLFNLGGLTIFKYIGVSLYLAGAVLLIPMGLLAFMLNKKIVFDTVK